MTKSKAVEIGHGVPGDVPEKASSNSNLSEHIDGYMRWITPSPGDPTFSVLRAHLLFEELLRAYLKKVLPHAAALDGSRLSFAQTLAVARACSPHLSPSDWIWAAIADLNKVRNLLAHETQPKALAKKLEDYIESALKHLPPPPKGHPADVSKEGIHFYSRFDIVTLGLYYRASGAMGFDVDS